MKKIILLIFLLGIMILESGCNDDKVANELKVYGNDIIKNNTIMVNDKYLSYEIPIILNQKINSFDIDEFVIVGKGEYDVKFKNLSGGEKYRGLYYYFINLEIKVNTSLNADFSVTSIRMNINDNQYEYNINDLHFFNAKEYFGSKCNTEKNNFVYNCEKAFLYQYIPENDTISFEINKDCTITELRFLDYVDIEKMEVYVNDKNVIFNDKLSLKKNDEVSFFVKLKYKSDVSRTNLLKTTLYVSYQDEKQKKCVFIDEQGLMIVDYQNDNFIKNYIKNVIKNENK